jgi:hypothetical protein
VPVGDGPSGEVGLEALLPGGVEARAGLVSEGGGGVVGHESEEGLCRRKACVGGAPVGKERCFEDFVLRIEGRRPENFVLRRVSLISSARCRGVGVLQILLLLGREAAARRGPTAPGGRER